MGKKFITVSFNDQCLNSIEKIKKCKLILKQYKQDVAVVVGVIDINDFNINKKFLELGKCSAKVIEKKWKAIEEYFVQLYKELKLKGNYKELLAYTCQTILKKEQTADYENFVASRANYLSSFILSEYFGLLLNEPDNLVELERVSDEVDFKKNQLNINGYVIKSFIVGGHYCKKENQIKYFGNSGIELISAIIAICLGSDTYVYYNHITDKKAFETNISAEETVVELMSGKTSILNLSALQLLADSTCLLLIKDISKLDDEPISFFSNKVD